jgi:hypothetical protein
MALLANIRTFRSDKRMREKVARDWSSLTDLCPTCGVGPCRWGYSVEEQRPHLLLKIVGMTAHFPCYLATPGGSTLLTCGALPGLDGEKAEVPSTPRTILDVGSEWLFRFSLTV